MSPYKIEMLVTSYTTDKEPRYSVNIYDRGGKWLIGVKDISKADAVKAIANYCGVEL